MMFEKVRFARIALLLSVALLWLTPPTVTCAEELYSFGVIAQRSPMLTAQFWNPILDYVSVRAGVKLEMQMARSGDLSSDAVVRGDYDFAYSNHQFKPSASGQGYSVILRNRGEEISSQIVVLESAAQKSVADLHDVEVGFANPQAFLGYTVPMEHMQRSGIRVKPVFGGNQEGIMAQLKAGSVIAAGVNSVVMRDYAAREGLKYRVLWQSERFPDLAVSAHPRVPAHVVQAVRRVMSSMAQDAEGARVLEASARVINQKPPYGFDLATQQDYQPYIDFYKRSMFRGAH